MRIIVSLGYFLDWLSSLLRLLISGVHTGRIGSTKSLGIISSNGVSFQPVDKGWVVRLGYNHIFGNEYTASCHLEASSGIVRGLAGSEAPVSLQLKAKRLATKLLGFKPIWERIDDMADKLGDGKYHVIIKAVDKEGNVHPTVDLATDTYEAWCDDQDIIEAGFKSARDKRRNDRPS